MNSDQYKHYINIAEATVFAIEKHGLDYYNNHLFEIYNILAVEFAEYKFSEDVLIASLLHDVLEDTDTAPIEITNKFGLDVLYLVDKLTDKEGKNRKERHRNTYPLIRLDDESIAIKLADRIQNVRRSPKGERHYEMYKSEYGYFRNTLYHYDFPYKKMWIVLDKLMVSHNG